MPADIQMLEQVEPQFEEYPGWLADTSGARKWSDLPDNARRYLDRITGILQTPIDMVSVGPHREQTILLRDPFNPVPQQVERLVQSLDREG
jgi:adenylosuccinate synthase